MPYSSLKRILIVAGVLFAIGAVALLPTTWAAPNLIPARQTVPSPTVPVPTAAVTATPVSAPAYTPVPVPTGSTIVVAPALSLLLRVPIVNASSAPMEGCQVLLEEITGIQYLMDNQVQSAPYAYPLETLAVGAETSFEVVAALSSLAMPCETYTIPVRLQCGDETTLLQEYRLAAPCDILPNTGG